MGRGASTFKNIFMLHIFRVRDRIRLCCLPPTSRPDGGALRGKNRAGAPPPSSSSAERVDGFRGEPPDHQKEASLCGEPPRTSRPGIRASRPPGCPLISQKRIAAPCGHARYCCSAVFALTHTQARTRVSGRTPEHAHTCTRPTCR